jgi:CHAT domain-containing protein/tetratricopeptide (TPR) repeat protein
MRRILPTVVFALALLGLVTRPAPTAVVPISPSERRILTHADSLLNAGRAEQAYAFAARERRAAQRAGDTALESSLLAFEGGSRAWRGEPRRAEPLLRRAVSLADAGGDSLRGAAAAKWLGFALTSQGRFPEAESVYQQWLPVATAAADTADEVWLRLGYAYCALNLGRADEARAGYERAARLFQALGNRWGELEALIGLGRAYDNLGEFDRATTTYRRVAREARATSDATHEAYALNNLGASEYVRGDPAAAAEAFEQARKLHSTSTRVRDSVVPTSNVAIALTDLGRFDEAAALFDSLLISVRASGFRDAEAIVLGNLAELRRKQGRMASVAELTRAVLAIGPAAGVESRVEAMIHLARALVVQDSAAAAVRVMDGEGRRLRRGAPFDAGLRFDLERVNLYLVTGRWRDAERIALAAERAAATVDQPALRATALRFAGEAAFQRGDVRLALARLRDAASVWEHRRSRIRDANWREQYDGGREISMMLATVLLADTSVAAPDVRVRFAFDALQRFKARTLLERTAGPGGAGLRDSVPVPSLAALQREVIRDGEVLLDAFVGEDTTYLFAVTPSRCQVIGLPGEGSLAERLRVHHDLAAERAEGTDERRARMLDRAGRELGAWVLGDIADVVHEARTILFAPDGALHLLVLEGLFLPGEQAWLGDRRVIAHTPSATLLALARARARAQEGDGEPARTIAVAASRGPAGESLTGALAEARWLARNYERIDLKLDGVAGSTDLVNATLGLYDVLHFAAHAQVDDQHPWRSGVLLRPAARGTQDAFLRAEDILALELPARIAVLSGCESAGVRGIAGEGLHGLSSAFVCAGVPAVIATRWPVDDRGTAEFMKSFYAGLGRGATAGEALAGAKRALARSRRTADPFYWAGFVLVGDPDVRIPLRRRPDATVVLGLTVAVMAVAAILAILSRRRRDGPV